MSINGTIVTYGVLGFYLVLSICFLFFLVSKKEIEITKGRKIITITLGVFLGVIMGALSSIPVFFKLIEPMLYHI